MKSVKVNRSAANKLKNLFPWVYKSDVDDLAKYEPGEIVKVVDEKERFLALGYINPRSTIAVRVLSFKDHEQIERILKSNILRALASRQELDATSCRLIYSEADMLPGLIVDKYEEYLSVQILSAGMERLKNVVLDFLINILEPKGVYIRGEEVLKKEGLEPYSQVIGQIPERIVMQENGIKFEVDIQNSQKTGFYLDQRKNRLEVTKYVKQKDRVLDCFCNTGGFGLYARVLKRAKVTAVDISAEAIEQAKRNYALNEVDGEFVVANVFDYLRDLRKKKEQYDLIILDPPSFAKSRSKKSSAIKGFKDITVNAMKIVKNNGFIALFSCSHHIQMDDLEKVVIESARDNRKLVHVYEHLYQDIDHPYLISHPFSLYLKGLLFRVSDL
ncbi:class I SAM-dependent rRNA methyltransferase [Nitratiruptor sp. YY09-18]|uniref:class I SAM-dependent rRNA methyltransferase n=1 Tax=Nitratiruptor sp. YY09-18 TaxID=2724901 RepID=UPI001915B6B8|nr:class I SAM-dependent rRNA methyltransferase [Nitratiruptor sp. YY09-18]BCD67867.1 23S rRNA (cytosine1962-C5)-methyltransferase [Nitratiruptor sp. YY09-18]